MIRKNIDIIAVFVLLCGIGLYSRAREARILEVIPNKRIALSRGMCPVSSVLHQLSRIQLKKP